MNRVLRIAEGDRGDETAGCLVNEARCVLGLPQIPICATRVPSRRRVTSSHRLSGEALPPAPACFPPTRAAELISIGSTPGGVPGMRRRPPRSCGATCAACRRAVLRRPCLILLYCLLPPSPQSPPPPAPRPSGAAGRSPARSSRPAAGPDVKEVPRLSSTPWTTSTEASPMHAANVMDIVTKTSAGGCSGARGTH